MTKFKLLLNDLKQETGQKSKPIPQPRKTSTKSYEGSN